MQWSELGEQPCSFARTLAVLGDRWTLMVLRDCFLRVRRFEDFQARLGIARPVLTDRLNKLVAAEVLLREPYQRNPLRHEYRLTEKGLDLYPVILGMVHWGDRHTLDGGNRPLLHQHRACGHDFDPIVTCSSCHEEIRPREVSVRAGVGNQDCRHLPVESKKVG